MCSSVDSGYSRSWTSVDHLVPQHARLHDVPLLHRGHLAPPRPGEVEGDARDPLDLVGVVDLGVDGALLAVAEVADLLGLAEIDAAGELADDQDVEPVDQLALERRGVGERRIADRRPEIGEELQILAEPQEPGLGAHVVGHLVPFRPAHRAEEHRVGGERLLHGRVGDRLAVSVIGRAADEVLLVFEAVRPVLVEPGDHPLHLGHHLRPDAVAGEEKEVVGGHGAEPSLKSSGAIDEAGGLQAGGSADHFLVAGACSTECCTADRGARESSELPSVIRSGFRLSASLTDRNDRAMDSHARLRHPRNAR